MTVSRFHCELVADAQTVRVRDLASSNGTIVDGVWVHEATLRSGQTLRLGNTELRFLSDDGEETALASTTTTRFGTLCGTSERMRAVLAQLERVAGSNVSVLLEGETGTGKGAAAEAIHAGSPRATRPFVVIDASAIPATLLESELFGHERGAFTGAVGSRPGAFEQADGGTLFLDEMGELPLELQPKLLRALEQRTIKRIGGSRTYQCDVRIVAATNRELRTEVNAGRFRADLYYRLAVVSITMPSLRERLEDLPVIVEHLLTTMGASSDERARATSAQFFDRARAAAWPGNVRELRNYLERYLVLGDEVEPASSDGEAPRERADLGLAIYAEARRAAIEEFERGYVRRLLDAHAGNVAAAAAAARVHKVHLYRVMRRHGLRGA